MAKYGLKQTKKRHNYSHHTVSIGGELDWSVLVLILDPPLISCEMLSTGQFITPRRSKISYMS